MATIKIPDNLCVECPLGPLDCPLQIYVNDGTPQYPNCGHSEPGPDCPGPGVYYLASKGPIDQLLVYLTRLAYAYPKTVLKFIESAIGKEKP